MYETLLRHFIPWSYNLLARYTRFNAWKYFQSLQAAQWQDQEILKQRQWQKCQAMLQHAVATVPYYQNKWKAAGLDIGAIRSPNDFQNIPISTKKDIQAHFPADTTSSEGNRQDWAMVQTSGSTGNPFRLYIDWNAYNIKYALLLRGYFMSGWHFGKSIVSIWHRGYGGYFGKYTGQKSQSEPHHHIRNLVYQFIHRKQILPPLLARDSALSDSDLQVYIKALNRCRPDLLEANEFYFLFLAEYLREHPEEHCHIPALNCIGLLTEQDVLRIEAAFGGRLYNRYGPHEMEGIAHQCDHKNGMHVSIDSYLLEFVRPDGSPCRPGEIGRLILTDLDNRAMPLIRYEIGDLGGELPHTCPCGRQLPLMREIEGRLQDSFVDNNRYITEKDFLHFFQEISWLQRFQVREKEDETLEIDLVPRPTFRNFSESAQADLISELRQAFLRLFSRPRALEIQLVPAIFSEESGKFRYVKRSESLMRKV